MLNPSKELINILVVDDDDADAKAVKRGFSQSNLKYQILRAQDGFEALELLKKTNEVPHIIILVDINMPKMNGFEFIKELRKEPILKQSIVFALSTSNSEEDKKKAYDLNVAGYITKNKAGKNFENVVKLITDYTNLIELPS